MSGQPRKGSFSSLPPVPSVHKQRHCPCQRPQTPREAAALASQPREIMPQFCIVPFDAEGLAFTRRNLVLPRIEKLAVSLEAITEVVIRRGRVVHDLLHRVPIALPDHAPADDAAIGSVYARYDVSGLFFWEMNV